MREWVMGIEGEDREFKFKKQRMLRQEGESSANVAAMGSPWRSPEKEQEREGEFTTPKSMKKPERLRKLQNAPNLTNSFDFTGTNDSTPKRQKKSRGRDCTPGMSGLPDIQEDTKSNGKMQAAFTTLLEESDHLTKTRFQLLHPESQRAAMDCLERLDFTRDVSCSDFTLQLPLPQSTFPALPEPVSRDGQRERGVEEEVAEVLVRLYFFTFNGRNESLASLFVCQSAKSK